MAKSREDLLKDEFETKLKSLHKEQANCNHQWGKVEYDPEIKSEPYGCRIEKQGVDVWSVPEGYRDVEYKRWSRTCTKCGKIEYTTEQRPTHYEPYFS